MPFYDDRDLDFSNPNPSAGTAPAVRSADQSGGFWRNFTGLVNTGASLYQNVFGRQTPSPASPPAPPSGGGGAVASGGGGPNKTWLMVGGGVAVLVLLLVLLRKP